MLIHRTRSMRQRLRATALWVKALVLAGVGAMPALSGAFAPVYAAPTLPEREARITTSEAGATFDITFEFDLPTGFSSAVQSIAIDFCDAPLGTCANTLTPTLTGAAYDAPGESGWDQATDFTNFALTNSPDGGTNNRLEIDRTEAGLEANPTNDRTLRFTGLVNNALENRSYYPRIVLYSDTGHTTEVAEGVVAQSTARQLTVNARVQERLDFCTGVTATNDATSSVATDCANLTDNGNTIDIGVVDASQVCVSSPNNPCDGDNGFNGVAMVRTNAFNGVVIDYFAEQDTTSGKLKVVGATCGLATSVVDQCFNSADTDNDPSNGATQMAIAAGTEKFGMTVAGVNCGSTSAYTCDFSLGTYNLVRDAEYDGSGANTFNDLNTQNWAWDDDGSTDRIASSAGSAVKVVEDEALLLKFAATASVTTPTGQYTVTSTYIATATF